MELSPQPAIGEEFGSLNTTDYPTITNYEEHSLPASDTTINSDQTTDFYSDDGHFCEKTEVQRSGAIIMSVVLPLVIALSLLGNLLVLVVLTRYERLRALTNAFMLNLAVSELLFTCGLPFWVSYHLIGWSYGDVTCKAISFLFYAGYYSSGFFLIVMTLHRYLAVFFPLSHLVSGPSHSQGVLSLVISLVVWTISLLAATPAAIFSKVIADTNNPIDPTDPGPDYYNDHDAANDSQYFQHCQVENISWRDLGVYQQNVLFLLMLLVFCVCYSQILFRLHRPKAGVKFRVSRQNSGGDRRNQRTVRLILGLVVVFFVGWAPFNLVIFLRTRGFDCDTSNVLDYCFYVARLLAFSQCCLNPLLYVFIGMKFRNHLKRMLKGCCHGVTVVNNHNSSVLFRSSRLTSQSSGADFSL
ncbi:chemokine XC receptor 1 [Esox lucius]|uniref:G-protein coupled receptors family 1 profile domain-containing protein n=1 Tax=Esox lucius TaxID=8010 RepID=A0AAY5KGF5_ESOLU|nr:chemokine XC receptor 1 [Esox lucius]